MRASWLFLVSLALLFPWLQGNNPTSLPTAHPTVIPGLTIQSPKPGQALQGKVVISGSANPAHYKSADLSFAYSNNPTDTWFPLAEIDTPVERGTLAEWDTTTITDGNYSLRLIATLDDGNQVMIIVHGLRVRNYTAIETDTPQPDRAAPASGEGTGRSTTPSPSMISPTVTPLPRNPLEFSTGDIRHSLEYGALAVGGIFALAGIYALMKHFREGN